MACTKEIMTTEITWLHNLEKSGNRLRAMAGSVVENREVNAQTYRLLTTSLNIYDLFMHCIH